MQGISLAFWTSEITKSFCNANPTSALEEYFQKFKEQINEIVEMICVNLPMQHRITLGALVILNVHARDTLNELIESKVSSPNDFKWLSQVPTY